MGQRKGVMLQAYKPLQRGGSVLTDKIIGDISTRLGKSAAQVCIRWCIQKGLVVLSKTVNPGRMEENKAVFDFELTADDMAALDGLTTEDAVKTAFGHYEKRRSGTPAPWG